MHFTMRWIYNIASVNTATGVDNDYANFKDCNTTSTKRNKSDGLKHGTMGLAIATILIIFIYFFTHLLQKYQIRSVTAKYFNMIR